MKIDFRELIIAFSMMFGVIFFVSFGIVLFCLGAASFIVWSMTPFTFVFSWALVRLLVGLAFIVATWFVLDEDGARNDWLKKK